MSFRYDLISYTSKKHGKIIMGKLIIDGNSCFEIDEECIKKRKIPKNCDLEKYLKVEYDNLKSENKNKKGDG